MIEWLVILVLVLCLCYFVFRYRYFKKATKTLYTDILEKRETQSLLTLTTHEQMPEFQDLVEQVNELFEDQESKQKQLHAQQKELQIAIQNITHDLRTPLTVASGYVQQLSHRAEFLDAEARDKFTFTLQQLETVNKRLTLLMDYYRILQGTLQLEPILTNVSEMILQTLLMYESVIEEKCLEVHLVIEENIQLMVDQAVLQRLLQNIFGNVLNHGQYFLAVELSKNTQEISLSVKNGLKAPITHIERLTERFYSEDLSKTSTSSGLGLFIVERFARELGGVLHLDATDEEFCLQIIWQIT